MSRVSLPLCMQKSLEGGDSNDDPNSSEVYEKLERKTVMAHRQSQSSIRDISIQQKIWAHVTNDTIQDLRKLESQLEMHLGETKEKSEWLQQAINKLKDAVYKCATPVTPEVTTVTQLSQTATTRSEFTPEKDRASKDQGTARGESRSPSKRLFDLPSNASTCSNISLTH